MVVAQNWESHGPRYNFKPAPLSHDGRVLDTPEINQAKQAHFAAHDAAKRALPNQRPGYTDYIHEPRNQDYGSQRYTSPQYNQKYQQPQQEYNQKYQPSQEYNRDYDNYDDRSSDDYSSNNVEKKWRGPPAKIELTSDGKFVKETPEVAHARQQHLAAFSAVKQTRPSVGYEGSYDGGYNKNYQGEGENRNYNNGGNSNSYKGSQYAGYQGEDDGQYRGEGDYSAQYNQPKPSYGSGNQYQGRQQGYY